MGKVRGFCPKPYFFVASLYRITAVARLIIAVIRLAIVFIRSMSFTSSYYKVVVFIVPLQGLYAILLEILWIVFHLLPLDGSRKATTTVSLYIC